MVDRPEGPTLTKTYGREKNKGPVPGFTGKREEEERKRAERSDRLRLKEQVDRRGRRS